MTFTLLFLSMTACASRTMKMPGPMGPIADVRPPPVHVQDLPKAIETPEEAKPRESKEPRKRQRASGFGDAVAKAAQHHLDHAPAGYRNDCSGFVMAAYGRAGLTLSGSTRTLWERAQTEHRVHRRPQPGDIAFFDNTYDRNRNGKRDDPLTHVAVVTAIDGDGTIHLAHAGTSKGRTTLTMNLDHPGERLSADGKVLNDWLRARRKSDPKSAKLLAGELFRGFARFEPDAS